MYPGYGLRRLNRGGGVVEQKIGGWVDRNISGWDLARNLHSTLGFS